MIVRQLARLILEGEALAEATLRRPPRSSRWVATFTGPEPGEQIARSTGLKNKRAAMKLAREWEAEARGKRRLRQSGGERRTYSGRALPGLSQEEVAAILGLSVRGVRSIERRAIRKLKRHPLLRQIWAAQTGMTPTEVEESRIVLTPEEVRALRGLMRTALERWALVKVLALRLPAAPER